MKHILLFLFFLWSVVACTTEEKKDEPKKEIIEPIVEQTPEEFNNMLSIMVNAVHEMITELQQLDETDAAPDVIISAAEKHLINIENVIQDVTVLQPVGELGVDLKELTLQYIGSKKAIINIYIDFAAQLSIESEWTDEDYSLWTSQAEPYFGVSDQILDELSTLQEQFLAKNNLIPAKI